MPTFPGTVTPIVWLRGPDGQAYADAGATTPVSAPELLLRLNDVSPLTGNWQAPSTQPMIRETNSIALQGTDPGYGTVFFYNGATANINLTNSTLCASWVARDGQGGPPWGLAYAGSPGWGVDGVGDTIAVWINNTHTTISGLSCPRGSHMSIVARWTTGGVTGVLSVDGVQTPFTVSASITPGTTSSGQIFMGQYQSTFYGSIIELVVVNRTVTDLEMAELLAYVDAIPAPPAFPVNLPMIAVAGDSIARGAVSVTQWQSWAGQMLVNIVSTGALVCNVAVTGGSALNAEVPALPFYNASRPQNILIIAAGTNDLANGNTTAYTLSAIYGACDKARAYGYRVAVAIILPRAGGFSGSVTGSSFETARQTVNTDLQTNWHLHADYLIDTSGVTHMTLASDATNATYFYSDNIHPLYAGHLLIEPIYRAAVLALLSDTFNGPQTQYAKHLSEFVNNGAGSALLVDLFAKGFSQNILLTASSCALTFTTPTEAVNITLRITQDAVGGKLVTWPGSFGGTVPTLNSAANADTVIVLYYTGSKFFFVSSTGPNSGSGVVNISAGTTNNNLTNLVFSNSNNISFGLNGSTITASFSGGGVGGLGAISAGTTSIGSGTVVFSNSNGVSFGLNGSVMTATVIAGATAGIAAIQAGSQTQTSGTLVFANSNGLTFGLSGSSQITGSYSVPTQYVFSNSNNVTFGTAGSTVTASVSNAASNSVQTVSFVNNTTVNASTTLNINSPVYAGVGIVSMGYSGGAIIVSATSNSNASAIISGNSTISSSGTYSVNNPVYQFFGNVSGGVSANKIVISGAQSNQTQAVIQAVQAGTTLANTGTVSFSNTNGISFGINGQILTASVNAGFSSIFSRSGTALVASTGDYSGGQVNNDSSVTGATVKDALNNLKTSIISLVFPTLAALIAYNATGLLDGTQAYVRIPNDIYELVVSPSAAVLAATDGINIIQPTTPSSVRWLRGSAIYNFVSDWYIDGTAGLDTNDGLTSGTALKTMNELCARLCPGGVTRTVYQNTNIHVASGTYSAAAIRLSFAGLFTVTMKCAFTSSANITTTALVNVVSGTTTVGSGTRGHISIASGTLAANQLLRCVSGSHVGAVTYVLETDGDAQHAYVHSWVDLNQTEQQMTAGDVFVIDTPSVDMSNLSIDVHNGATFRVEYLGSNVNNVCSLRVDSGDLDSIQFYACRGQFASNFSTGCNFWSCLGSWYTEQGYWRFCGCVFTTVYTQFNNCIVELAGPECIFNTTEGGGIVLYQVQLYVGYSYRPDFTSRGSPTGINVEKVAINVNNSAVFLLDGGGCVMTVQESFAIWGVNGASGTPGTGWQLNHGCLVSFEQPIPTTFPATIQIAIHGLQETYNHIPMYFDDWGTGFINEYNANAAIRQANSTALVSATNMYYINPTEGFYTISAIILVKTAGSAGSFAVFVTYTDPTGVSQHVQITPGLSITSLGSVSAVVPIMSDGSAMIQYSVESLPGTFTAGSLVYNMNITCRKENNV